MKESIENFTKLIAPWLLDSTPQALAAQYFFVVTAALLHLYQILRMRRNSVVVISHGRIWFGVLLGATVGLGYYRVALWLHPKGAVWWLYALYIVGVFITFTILKLLLYGIVVPFVGERRSIIDTKMSEAEKFNCNWPLIPRCTHQGLFYLVMFGVMFIKMVG